MISGLRNLNFIVFFSLFTFLSHKIRLLLKIFHIVRLRIFDHLAIIFCCAFASNLNVLMIYSGREEKKKVSRSHANGNKTLYKRVKRKIPKTQKQRNK